MKYPKTSNQRIDIKSLTLDEVEAFFADIGETKGRALRVYKQLWQRGAKTFDEMDNVAKSTRKKLSELAEITFLESISHNVAADGTQKFLWRIPQGGAIESVLIPDLNRDQNGKENLF